MSRLSAAERARDLPALGESGWQAVPGCDAIRKVWRFSGFPEAWGFMTRVALLAERLDHHPDWTNRYNIVDVTLTTHDQGGLGPLDIRMAAELDRLAAGVPTAPQDGAPILTLCEERRTARGD